MVRKICGTVGLVAALLMAGGTVAAASPTDHGSVAGPRNGHYAADGFSLEGTAEFSGRMVRLWKNETNGLVHADILDAQPGDVVFMKSNLTGASYNYTVVPDGATFVSTPELEGSMQACGSVGGTSGGGPWGGCTWF